jgi:type I restriction enzyme S subunit
MTSKNIPDGWKEYSLSAVANFISGYSFKSTEFKNKGVPLVKISNLKKGVVDFSATGTVWLDERKIQDKFILKNGDILLAMSGATAGKMARYQLDIKSYLNQRVGKIECKPEKINQDLLYYLMTQDTFLGNILVDVVGGAIPNVSGEDVSKIKVIIPESIEEQKKIAEILTNVDLNIQATQQYIHKLVQLHLGIIDEKIIKEFEKDFSLSDYFEINPTSTFKKLEKVSFIQMEDVNSGGGFIDGKKINSDTKGYTKFINDDIVIAKVTPCFENGKIFVAKNLRNKCGMGSSEFHVLRVKPEFDNIKEELINVCYNYLRSKDFIKKGISSLTGTGGLKRFSKDVFSIKGFIDSSSFNFNVCLFLSNNDFNIKENQNKLEKLKQTKKALMQDLLTGKKRV